MYKSVLNVETPPPYDFASPFIEEVPSKRKGARGDGDSLTLRKP
jgi:hypothetical protein